MKTRLTTVLVLTAGLLALGARAQSPTPAPAPATEPAAAPSRIIYAPRLPSPAELSSVASAQGLSIERIDQTAAQIIATYKAANGQLTTVSYQLLPNAATPSVVPAATTTTVVATTTPAPTVVYAQPTPTVVYTQPAPAYYPYVYADPYYPWGFYGPVAVSLGFDFYGGHGYHGGFYHGHGGHRR